MAVIENLDIVLGARTEKLDKGFDRSTGKVKKFESDINRMGKAAEATLAPLRQLGTNILAAIPGASAAAAAFSAIAAAFAGGVVVRVAKSTKDTAVSSKAAAQEMAQFATAATVAAAATGLIRRNATSAANIVPQLRIGTRSIALPKRNDNDVIDAEFKVLGKTTPQIAGVGSALTRLGPVGIAAGAAVAAGFVATASAAAAAIVTIRGVRQQLGEIDEIAKSASKANVTFRELAGFRLAVGESTGLGPEAADKALTKLQIRLAEAKRNGGALDDQLKSLGLDSGQLLEAGPLQAMKQLASATQQMKSPADQLVLAFRLFEEEGSALVNTLRGGPDAINATVAVADRLGLTLSQAQAKQVEAANDAWGRVELIATGAFRQIAAEVAPLIDAIATSVTDVAESFGGWQTVLPTIVDGLAYGTGYLYDWLELLESIFTTMERASRLDLAGAVEAAGRGLDFGTGMDLLAKTQQARAEAKAAAESGGQGSVDMGAIQAREEAAKAAAESAKQAAEERARAAQQNRDAVAERIGGLRDEIATLRMGADAVERMKLARQGATAQQLRGFAAMQQEKQRMEELHQAMERGKQLQEQFRSPQQQLRAEMADLSRLLNVGAIDFGTYARAAREAATRLGKDATKDKRPETPSFGALQKGSVEAFSAALKNERAGSAESLQKESNGLLRNVNTHLERMNARIANLQGASGV
jgi:hypothetical protein